MNNKKVIAWIIGIVGLVIFLTGLVILILNFNTDLKSNIGTILAILGLIICAFNYPIYRYLIRKTKTRKILSLKKSGFTVLKSHYFALIVICIISASLGVEFASSFTLSYFPNPVVSEVIEFSEVVYEGKYEEINSKLNKELAEIKEVTKDNIFARNKGVISDLINSFSNGMIFYNIIQVINTITGSINISLIILLVGFAILYISFWYFILNTIPVITRRIFLEARQYKKLSFRKYLYLIKTKKLVNVANVMFRKFIFLFLWGVTIIMPFIKLYSYKMVEYIVAENPSITPKQAIALSRKMMYGHKMEALLLDLSFIHWEILNLLTLGVLKIIYINAYRTATNIEFYYDVRKQAIENKIEGYELLNDKYLYEYATKSEIESNYEDYYEIINKNLEPVEERKGILGFIERNLGITFESKEYNNKFKLLQNQEYIKGKYNELMEGKIYPNKLNPNHVVEKENNTNYLSRYTVINLIAMFFIIAILGWVWEVILIFMQSGIVANRGAMTGPWLPIYGSGAIIVMLTGYKLRKRPFLEFVFIFVMCGILEYLTSYIMEISTGLRWWDYTGNFLNINGRICLEGLITFGIAGFIVIYFIAPFLDKLLSKIKFQILLPIVVVLITFFTLDLIYSNKNPNIGEGITSKLIINNIFRLS